MGDQRHGWVQVNRRRTEPCLSRKHHHSRMNQHNGLSLYLLRYQCNLDLDCGREDGRTLLLREVDAVPRSDRHDLDALGH